MDVNADLAAVLRRIEEIAGAIAAPAAQPGAFASMVSDAMNATAAVAGLPQRVPLEQIDQLVQSNGSQFDVDPSLVKAVIANESGFNSNATSRTGAQGLMQLEPATAASLGVNDAYDPAQNVAGGTRYLRGLLNRFDGDLGKAIAAYNAGPGAVEKYGGIPPYAETQNYVRNVLSSYQEYRRQP